ncbi:hypothetical protein AUEXF2481DRAFT_38675 [Aureobasidium subglaciale EXF-2481]|uniref:Uncharacterized protein n=1 Tax=Aureobasidium subglaciale (strain EXF-2481) TaxID=1043005 RepID=A0A074YK00_AURSE|nr:uncharacterized protein AUEXF2481DRAFT_38675 [Aureobasidium subglaciale EXF-2481]KAI5203238.1 hypothetical protein E4T38_05283 [Aureobasidium subglaciale]KAI5213356.1 hypothetical protein E4T40_09809 [Aureobasidium subglaciale]KAI5215718.1 hypothetical protein E4T41_09502 [Aureobasidium subglaciale]KAI5253846.1 hypothetical protein E4T46_09432 [Aureobasidium subglaciale]KEQ96409.1 hypothetical protein AUEXF2481DRAFT_38675 [Aureobasidium subglaciale EXF-2481]
MVRDAITPPPPPTRLRTPPTPLHGAGYHSYGPYEPRRSQRVSLLHNKHDKTPQSSHSSRKSTFHRSDSSQTLSPPSSPAANYTTLQQTPARPTPARQLLFSRNRPTNTPDLNSRFDVFAPQPQLQTPASMLPTPHKTPRKCDAGAMKSTARVLDFNPVATQSAQSTPRKKTKSRLTLDEDDDVHEEINVFTDIQDRVPTLDKTEDNPFVGPRMTRGRSRARAQLASSVDVDMEAGQTEEDGIFFVFRGKKVFRRFETSADAFDGSDPDVSTRANDSLKRQAGAAASRPLTRSSFKARLLWPSADAPADADEEALTDIDEDSNPIPKSAPFGEAVPTTKTPSKKLVGHPATPPSSHRQARPAGEQISIFADPHNDLNLALASPSIAAPMPKKVTTGPLFAGWSRSKSAEERAATARGEKRRLSGAAEPEVPAKRSRSALFSSDRR